ncbi:hypothetical protein [Candidatus Reidiella endopervernicosa]|uniref:Uncharacterized protein n=1 Tax=Candidatus Reidiella endopervernicosa TaxID=2738883 RepID=A0A6N0HXI2_9GAMM|nr:hypothetical protein [Candidatus Reidiella endopervernicosa]QKQ26886.1 hypothetical protein HUE57_11815 [Candidatus Reidiella endopervernicosa]
MLSVMGYNLIDLSSVALGINAGRYTCDQLPVIVLPTAPDDTQMTFVGGEQLHGSAAGATGNLTINPLRKSNSSNLDRLLVFYHPEQKQDLDELTATVSERIDTASAQVFIETLVVEISSEDSKELGVEWQSANIGNHTLLTLGQMEIKDGDSVSYESNTRMDEAGDFTFNPGSVYSLNCER